MNLLRNALFVVFASWPVTPLAAQEAEVGRSAASPLPPPVTFHRSSPFFADREIPTPPGSPLTRVAFELGEKLFFEPMLSKDRRISCASCHRPDFGFAAPEAEPLGIDGLRNAPTLYNRAYGTSFSWDGRATTLEEQSLLPIENPQEMDLPIDEAVARLAADDGYRAAFVGAYGKPPNRTDLGRALATYTRAITIGDSPVDRFRAGDRFALNDAERAGLWVWESKGKCWKCHPRPAFTDEAFHNTGVGVVDGTARPGRFAITNDATHRGAFKTPTLRGLVFTAPYMHDGSLATLEEVVAFYRRGGNANPDLDAELEPLDLTDREADNLVAFLRALSRQAPPRPAGEATGERR